MLTCTSNSLQFFTIEPLCPSFLRLHAGLLRESGPIIMAASSFSSRRNPFAHRAHETIVSAPGSLQGADISIDDLTGCDVFIMDHTAAIYIDECTDCRIRIGPVAGFCFFRNCSNCIISVACQQFRAKECKEMTVFLYSASDPHIEMCKDVTIGPYNFAYPLQDKHFKKAGLNPQANLWSQVYDHTPATGDDRNWQPLEPVDFSPIMYRLDDLGEPIDPVVKPSIYSSNGVESVIVFGSQVHNKFKASPQQAEEDYQPEIIQEEDPGKLAEVDLDAPDNEATYMPPDWGEGQKVASPKREEHTPSGWDDVTKKPVSPHIDSRRSPRPPVSAFSASENPLLHGPVDQTAQPPPVEGAVQVLVLYTKESAFVQEIELAGYALPPQSMPQSLERASAVARPYHEQIRMLTISGFCVLISGLILLLALVLIYDFVNVHDGGLAIQLFLLIVATVGLLVYIFIKVRRIIAQGNQDFRKMLEEETVTTYNQCGLALGGDLFAVQVIARPKNSLQQLLR